MDSLKQMNLAMQYIESHLTEEIDFKELSRIACCSEYHFRRVFSFLAGMSVSEYIRLRRLAYAPAFLKNGNEKIIMEWKDPLGLRSCGFSKLLTAESCSKEVIGISCPF